MIGEVIRVTRIANDMTIQDLSRSSQVSKSYITEVEKGKKNPSKHVLDQFSKGLDLATDDLLALDEYHNFLMANKEKLQVYRLLLSRVLETYIERESLSRSLKKTIQMIKR